MTKLNLGLDNKELYNGCEIETVGGRLNLKTPVKEAIEIIGSNANEIVRKLAPKDEIILTGAMAVWAYLIVFHAVVHRFSRVYYDDGRGNCVLIAAHG